MNGLACVLCGVEVDLFDLDDWSGWPAHRVCAAAAQQAFDDACEPIAAEHRKLGGRLGRRYERAAG